MTKNSAKNLYEIIYIICLKQNIECPSNYPLIDGKECVKKCSNIEYDGKCLTGSDFVNLPTEGINECSLIYYNDSEYGKVNRDFKDYNVYRYSLFNNNAFIYYGNFDEENCLYNFNDNKCEEFDFYSVKEYQDGILSRTNRIFPQCWENQF